jgi:anti-sigma factor RsiW
MFRSVILAVSLVVSAAVPGHAGGSMGREVKTIYVQQSLETRRRDEIRQIEKRRAADQKSDVKQRLADGKALVKQMEVRQKEYDKKVTDYGKKMAKKRK